MIKHYINYEDNIYYIEIDNIIVMSIQLDKKLSQVNIKTPKEVYSGPVDLISFKEDLNQKK